MWRWKPLASAVSQAHFDAHMAAFEAYVERELIKCGAQPGDYDEFARQLGNKRTGLTREEGESSKDFCRRVLLQRRPAADKPLDEAFRPPGRRPRADLR
jgi:hypothetical protein